MARATVFVDDAVRGRLPGVCVLDGAPATRSVHFRHTVGGPGALSLLLLAFGPVGWVVLLLLPGAEALHTYLPVCEHTIERWSHLRRDRWIAGGALVVTGAVLLATRGALGVWLLTAVAVAAFAAAHLRLVLDGVGVRLDASRRWVTLTGVHARFAEAVRAEQQRADC